MTAGRDELELKARVDDPAAVRAAPRGACSAGKARQRRGRYRHREEWESRVDDPKAVLMTLRRLGYRIVRRIDRAIEQFRLGDATVRLEWYPAMDARFLPESIPCFVRAYEERTGRTARVARLVRTP